MCCRYRDAESLAKSQIGFIEFVCAPHLHAISRIFPHVSWLAERMEANRAEWEKRKVAAEAKQSE